MKSAHWHVVFEHSPPLFQLLMQVEDSMSDLHALLTGVWRIQSAELVAQGFLVPAPAVLDLIVQRLDRHLKSGIASWHGNTDARAQLSALVFYSGMLRQMPDQVDLAPFDGFLDWVDRSTPVAAQVNERLETLNRPQGEAALLAELGRASEAARHVWGRHVR